MYAFLYYLYTQIQEREGKRERKQVIYSIDLNKVCIDIFLIYIYIYCHGSWEGPLHVCVPASP